MKYSRLISVQEKKHRRQAVFFAFLTLTLLVFLVFWGLPTLAKFSAFLADLKGGDEQNETSSIKPPPPIFSIQDMATNSAKLQIKGTAKPKTKLFLLFNSSEKEIDVAEDGTFGTEIILRDGGNQFSAKVKDDKNNESQTSSVLRIIYDSLPPEITIDQPLPGQISTEKKITIKGSVNEDAQITVNGRPTPLLENNFSIIIDLQEGDNTLTIIGQDSAGNKTEKLLKVIFTP